MIKALDVCVTDYCGVGCANCSMGAWRRVDRCLADFITGDALTKILNDFLPDIILLSGGEPTEHPDIRQILELSKTYSDKVFLQTFKNGRHWILGDGVQMEAKVVNGYFSYDVKNKILCLRDKFLKNRHEDKDLQIKKLKNEFDYRVVSCQGTVYPCWGNTAAGVKSDEKRRIEEVMNLSKNCAIGNETHCQLLLTMDLLWELSKSPLEADYGV